VSAAVESVCSNLLCRVRSLTGSGHFDLILDFDAVPICGILPVMNPIRMLLAVLSSAVSIFAANPVAAERPNILVVMVDDLGFSDIGCYGSEIETPNLDRLARNGLRFNQFYNTAKCHSSRISLLTGRYALQAGNTSLKRATTSAEVLQSAGYFTAMTGKWHLDREPTDFGFQRYFGHLSGACNFYKGDKTFRLNGKPWQVPESGFYTTVAMVDHALNFLTEARSSEKPWYLYVAFNAPHAPLQPLKQDYEKYEGRYDSGWDVVRNRRLAKQRELGLFGAAVKPSLRPEHIPAWDDLPVDRQTWEKRRMTALAGMIDRVDQELGRLFDNLRRAGEMDDTLILFVSDNGACPYDRRSPKMGGKPYDPDVTWSDSTGWAWARNAPFRYYKQNQFEGGICTPAIVHWPNGLKRSPGSISDQPAHLIDVLPTLAAVGKVQIPSRWPGRELEPIAGISLLPLLQGGEIRNRPPIHFLFGTDRALRDGDWKLASFRSQPWELYNLRDDRTELHNVAAQHPDRLVRMSRQWHEMSANVLKAPKKSNQPVANKATGHVHPEWTAFKLPLAEVGKSDRKARRSSPASRNGATDGIRARKDTKLKVIGNRLQLEFTGNDSGIAIDRIGKLDSAGPYLLSFRLKAEAGKGGEVFFQTDPSKNLPRSSRIEFEIVPDGEWRELQIKLDTKETLLGLRLDGGDRPGNVVISDLTLRHSTKGILRTWPNRASR
jgi:arylsulfatase A-like enzyme